MKHGKIDSKNTVVGTLIATDENNELISQTDAVNPTFGDLTLEGDLTLLNQLAPNIHIKSNGLDEANSGEIFFSEENLNYGWFIRHKSQNLPSPRDRLEFIRKDPQGEEVVYNYADSGIQFGDGARIVKFSTDGTLVGNSDTIVPTEKAVKTYADGSVADANTHITSDGSDHGFIDQDVTTTASPEFATVTAGNGDEDHPAYAFGGAGSTLGLWANGATSVVFGVDSDGYVTLSNLGLKLNLGVTISEFSTDGTLAGNSDLAVPTERAVKTYVDDKIDSIPALLTRSSGIIDGFDITIASTSTIDISSGTYLIEDATDLLNPISEIKTFAGVAGLSIPTSLTHKGYTSLLIDINGTIVQSANNIETREQVRTTPKFGSVTHILGTGIDLTTELWTVAQNPNSRLTQYMYEIGIIKDGYGTSPAANDLTINIESGDFIYPGINVKANPLNPDSYTYPAQQPVTMAVYATQSDIDRIDSNVAGIQMDVANYDLGGVITPIGGGAGSAVVHRVYIAAGITVIQYGQNIYSSIATAIDALFTGADSFIESAVLDDISVQVAYIIATRSATDFNDPTHAVFYQTTRLGDLNQSTGAAQLVDLQKAYENGIDPHIVTDVSRGPVTIKGGTGDDADNILVVKNTADAEVFEINGEGDVNVVGELVAYGQTGDKLIKVGTDSSSGMNFSFQNVGSTVKFGSVLEEGTDNAAALIFYGDGRISLSQGVAIREFSIDGTLSGNSDSAVPTEKAIKTYVDGSVTDANTHITSDGSDHTFIDQDVRTTATPTFAEATLGSGTNINEFSVDGTLAGDSDDAVPTEKAVKTYVDTQRVTNKILTVGFNNVEAGQIFTTDVTDAMTLVSVRILAEETGDVVFDIYKDTYANHPATVADTICSATKPTLSSANKYTDSTLSGWTTAMNVDDTLKVHVDSVSGLIDVTLRLEFEVV